MRKAVQISVLTIISAALIALVASLLERMLLPTLPPELRSRFVAYGAALVAVVGLLAGVAQISGYSLRNLLGGEEASQERTVVVEGDVVHGDKIGQDKVMRDKTSFPSLGPREAGEKPTGYKNRRKVNAVDLARRLHVRLMRLVRGSPGNVRWLRLWSQQRDDDKLALTHWLAVAELNFNPFGPEKAEHEPFLSKFRVDAHFEGARRRRPVIVFGAEGSGKTAAAFLIALDCADQPDRSREAQALPVYYEPPLRVGSGGSRRTHLKKIATAMAYTVALYLAHQDEDEYWRISQRRRESLNRLFSLWGESAEGLQDKLIHASPESRINRHFIAHVLDQYRSLRHDDFLEEEYLDLLADCIPRGFGCVYLLADVPGSPNLDALDDVAVSLRPLLDLIGPLKKRSFYLKLFLPAELQERFGDLHYDCEVLGLNWDQKHLAHLLDARIRAAGGVSLMALCGQDVASQPSADERLVQAADGSPQLLVRLGNRLLALHADNAKNIPKISHQEIDQVLGSLGQATEGEGGQ